jgi:glycine oxidase
MRPTSDVLIIGGGVIGLTTAYYLARDGLRVRVLDRSTPGSEASWAGAGIIPPGNPLGAKSAYDRLRAVSSRAWPHLSARLRELTSIDNGYRVCGGIEVFDSADDSTPRLWRDEGIEFEQLSPAATRELEPNARLNDAAAFLLPGVAQVRNPWHLRALVAACAQLGVTIEANRTVSEFRKSGDRVDAVTCADGTNYSAGQFLIASGAWSDHLLASLGIQIGVHPVRGQIVLFRSSRPLIRRIISFDKRYLVPREDGRILVGSTEEPEAGFEKRTTEAGVGELVRFATSVIPELAHVEIEKSWAGLRPGSPDGLPFIGAVPGWRNVFAATGHYRAGIQLSPGTGEIMADLLLGRTPAISLEAFRLDRPRTTPTVFAFRS